jgi:hypothetical protein
MSGDPGQLRVMYLPGMQGQGPGDRWFTRGLREGGIRDVELFDWTSHKWPLHNLRDRAQHARLGEELAEQIRSVRETDEARATVLVGHSTGAMVILEALRCFDEPAVEAAWFYNAAVSCGYDLRPSLGGARRICNVYSPLDWVVLSIGTKLFGSADGQNVDCAGHKPFCGPGSDDQRLEQIAYDPKWLLRGHYGGHLGVLLVGFARDIAAPMILERL